MGTKLFLGGKHNNECGQGNEHTGPRIEDIKKYSLYRKYKNIFFLNR